MRGFDREEMLAEADARGIDPQVAGEIADFTIAWNLIHSVTHNEEDVDSIVTSIVSEPVALKTFAFAIQQSTPFVDPTSFYMGLVVGWKAHELRSMRTRETEAK